MKRISICILLLMFTSVIFAEKNDAFIKLTGIVKSIEIKSQSESSQTIADVELIIPTRGNILCEVQLFTWPTMLGITKKGDKIKVKYQASTGVVYTVPRWFLKVFVWQIMGVSLFIIIIIISNYKPVKMDLLRPLIKRWSREVDNTELINSYLNGILKPIVDWIDEPDIIGVVECKNDQPAYMAITKKKLFYMVFGGELQFFQLKKMDCIKLRTMRFRKVPCKKLVFRYKGIKYKFYYFKFFSRLPGINATYLSNEDVIKIGTVLSDPFIKKMSDLEYLEYLQDGLSE